MKAIITAVDENVASAADTVHTYTAQNCTVDELMKRLQGVTYENVSFYQYDHSNITNNIIVYCDDATWNNEILPLLERLDSVDGDNTKTWIPIASKTDKDRAYAEKAINSNLSVMKTLYPDVFSAVNYKFVVVENKMGDEIEYKVVVYAEVTSAQATRMANLLEVLENA